MENSMEEIRSLILEQMDGTCDVSDPELAERISRQAGLYGKTHLIGLKQREKMEEQIFNSLRKLDVLQELLEREDVTEIMVNGTGNIFYEKEGCLYPWEKEFHSAQRLENVIRQIASFANKTVNESEPILDTRLEDGSRVNIVLPPASLDGPCITIRKFARKPVTLRRLVELGSLSDELRMFLGLLVQAGYNIFVSGGTGSGKTTFLNALSQNIPGEERVVTIEDSAELKLSGVKNLVRLEARCANANGAGEITIRELIRTSLRMRPDRIVVGEVRGEEALELLQANNTGHDGGMSTGHGNSCRDMLSRLETMVLMGMDLPLAAVRGQIAAGIDIMVHLGRMRDRTRKVLQVCELSGMAQGEILLHTLYDFQETGEVGGKVAGTWRRVGRLKSRAKLREKGLEKQLDDIYGKAEGKEDQ